jgi:hypothetical protein
MQLLVDQAMQMARSGHSSCVGASSVASSRIRNLRAAQNEAARTARLVQDLIDEEELEVNEQEAADAARLAVKAATASMIAAKAKSKGARARREFERKSFEINATLSEALAQIDDDYGLDAEDVDGWVGTTHGQTLEVYNVPVVPGFGDSEMKPQVSTPEVASGVSANCSTCLDVPVPGNEELETVDSANLIRDLAVDAEQVLSD